MGTRMKGLLKGLRYISNIFEEAKEHEIQIGLPTDVKHVAHIGWDGPSSGESPSWMKQYNGGGVVQSAPLNVSGQPRENPQVKWVSQDSARRKSTKSSARDLPELPKSSRCQFTDSSAASPSPKRDPSKSRSRRYQKSDSEGSGRSGRRAKELSNDATDSPSTPTSRKPADGPKKSRHRKSKESSLRSSKSKDKGSYVNDGSTKSEDSLSLTPFSDPESDNADSSIGSSGNKGLPASRLKPFVQEEEKGKILVS
ncbi:CRIB domain-containing protein RIC6-like [Apium graveolens]|uniref:CRIB domain-containing protein RIC6-like n=1 Tax=Apium graveolens TaxID=4045 RepID=UPI003D7B78DA